MELQELLISIFDKEIGILQSKRETNYGDGTIFEFEFAYKGKIAVKMLLMKDTPNNWFIHHEVSKEEPFLVRKIAYICERVQRIKESQKLSVTLSEDLIELKSEMFVKTAIRCLLQNFINKCFIFVGVASEKPAKIHTRSVKLELES